MYYYMNGQERFTPAENNGNLPHVEEVLDTMTYWTERGSGANSAGPGPVEQSDPVTGDAARVKQESRNATSA